MSGLVKAKKYNWKDSNIALFGSDTDRDVKKKAAETEPAWKAAGRKPGLQIWRINKFKVEAWPTDEYGEFYIGDSYIILNTYKDEESDKLLYDVHFWIGQQSTQDEYGTAAYKTVELDTLLDDVPVQHREVQHHESDLFKEYFKTTVYKKGGADSGFRHVEKKEYKPRIFRMIGKGKKCQAQQAKVTRGNIRSEENYIVDEGSRFWFLKGSAANAAQTYQAVQILQQMKSNRGHCEVETVDESDGGEALDRFFEAVDRCNCDDDDDDDDDDLQQQMEDEQEEINQHRLPKLLKLSDASGEMTFTTVKEGDINRKDFNSSDVFILDTPGHGLFVWYGRRASQKEKANGMGYAHKYLQSTSYPWAHVTCLKETQRDKLFEAALAA